jgi:hypothetical protein
MDSEIAGSLRRRVDEAGGSLEIGARELRDVFQRTRLTDKARFEIEAALKPAGLWAEPRVVAVDLDDSVRLYVTEPAAVPAAAPSAPPGWYPDPQNPVQQRYWDGTAWSDRSASRTHAGPPPIVPGPLPPSPTFRATVVDAWRRYRRWPRWLQWTAAVSTLIILIALLSPSPDDSGNDRQDPAAQASKSTSTPPIAAEEEARRKEEAQRREAEEHRKAEKRRRAAVERRRERAQERRRAAARRERERERLAREQAQATPEPTPDSGGGDCEPGYDPCVPSYPPDVNCPDVDGPIAVTGSDPHGLDRDGDGVGCEN